MLPHRIIGMATASTLSRNHQVTIVARNLPGDEPTIEWASPWAGASFIAGGCSSPREAKMQLDAFSELWRWSIAYPESSIKQITIEDFHDDKTEEDIWWKDYMPQVRWAALFGRHLGPWSEECLLVSFPSSGKLA